MAEWAQVGMDVLCIDWPDVHEGDDGVDVVAAVENTVRAALVDDDDVIFATLCHQACRAYARNRVSMRNDLGGRRCAEREEVLAAVTDARTHDGAVGVISGAGGQARAMVGVPVVAKLVSSQTNPVVETRDIHRLGEAIGLTQVGAHRTDPGTPDDAAVEVLAGHEVRNVTCDVAVSRVPVITKLRSQRRAFCCRIGVRGAFLDDDLADRVGDPELGIVDCIHRVGRGLDIQAGVLD